MAAGAVQRASVLLGLLFIANSVVAGSKYRGQSEVIKGHPFNVTCTVGINEGVSWTKDGKNLTSELQPYSVDERKVDELIEATLTVQNAKSAHAGSYQCNALHAPERHSVRIASETTLTGVYEDGYPGVRFLDMMRTSFNLTCNVQNPTTTPFTVNWFKDNSTVGDSTLAGRYHLDNTADSSTLTVRPPQDADNGTYYCRVDNAEAKFEVYGKPHARLNPNHNVVEGQQIKIPCNIVGQPWPTVSWMYNNGSGANDTVKEGERIRFAPSEAGAKDAVLVLTNAVPSDYGQYYCVANSLVGELRSIAVTTLRVKDKYAALWPFIGICAEVVVLCAIILVYEKRRSKNVDTEDSDTDNHDQKKS